jgi:predicted ATPase
VFSFGFKIRNFGAIKEADVTLKPLTIFLGHNSTGKTYLSYLLYEIFKSDTNISLNFERGFQDTVIDSIVRSKRFELDLEDYANKYKSKIENVLNDIYKNFGDKVLNSNLSFKNAQLEIDDVFSMKEWGDNNSMEIELYGDIKAIVEGKKFVVLSRKNITKRNLRKGSNPYKKFSDNLNFALTLSIKNALFPGNVYFLPSERSTLIQLLGSSFLIFARLLNKFNTMHFPKPVDDFFGYFDVFSSGKGYFEDASAFLENNILGGKVDLVQPKDLPKKVVYTFKDKKIDLYLSSSGVKALSSLDILLKSVLKKGDVLFIDEPEITLHPKNQMKLVEALSMAVNKGLNIVIATHSPYITDHFNNLILGAMGKDSSRMKDVIKQYGIGRDSLLDKEKVAAYEFKDNGEVANVFDNESGYIEWDTFGECSDQLSLIEYEMREALNKDDV